LLAAGVMQPVHLPEPHQLVHHRSSFSSFGCLPELPQPLLLSDLAKPVEVVVAVKPSPLSVVRFCGSSSQNVMTGWQNSF
jgi:hypothetical protein